MDLSIRIASVELTLASLYVNFVPDVPVTFLIYRASCGLLMVLLYGTQMKIEQMKRMHVQYASRVFNFLCKQNSPTRSF